MLLRRVLPLSIAAGWCLLSGAMSDALGQQKQPTTAQVEFFEKSVRPILAAHCFECHGADKQKGDLRLDTRSSMMEGGESGPAIVPGNPKMSLLIQAVHNNDI